MALGFKDTVANSLLNGVLRNGSYTGPTTIYIQLHTAAPGAAGTTAVAGNNTRKAVAWNVASGGSTANTSDIVWTSVSTSETYTNFTLWDASTAGNLQGDGTLTANAVTSGDTFTIASGTLTATLNVLS